jgi:hypothetical protein
LLVEKRNARSMTAKKGRTPRGYDTSPAVTPTSTWLAVAVVAKG